MNLAVSYSDYLRKIKGDGIEDMVFKSERVSNDEAKRYLELISSEYGLSYIHIVDFARMNDRYGRPKTNTFTYFDKNKGVGGSWVVISASPTSLSYIYHALVILDQYMGVGEGTGIIEVGCGYGGLFLAICYFSKILGIRLGEYTMIDLPDVVDLIRKYLLAHPLLTFGVSYRVLEMCPTGYYGLDGGQFFISNDCFTEMDEEYRKQYAAGLFESGIVKHGFINWQTVFGVSIDSVGHYLDECVFPDVVVEERPQMSCANFPNYFVRF
jgi:hypothetical protein